MASIEAYHFKNAKTNSKNDYKPTSEGVNYGFVDYKGHVSEILTSLEKGTRSGFSYYRALTLQEFWQNAEFVKITEKGYKEVLSHGIDYFKIVVPTM